MSIFIPIPKKSNAKQCSNYQTITLVDESQARIKIGRNINNLRCTEDNTLMAESEQELNSLLMMVKEESEKADVKFNIQKTKITAIGPIISWQIDGETMEAVTDIIFLGSKIAADGECSHEIKRHLLPRRKAMTNLDSILKIRDNSLPTKVYIVKWFSSSHVLENHVMYWFSSQMVFPVVMY